MTTTMYLLLLLPTRWTDVSTKPNKVDVVSGVVVLLVALVLVWQYIAPMMSGINDDLVHAWKMVDRGE